MQNRVIIRVWDHTYSSWADPRINPFAAFFTRGRIGHVSIETPQKYISFWPVSNRGWEAKIAPLFDARESGFKSSPEEDARLEAAHGNVAEPFTLCLYTLNWQAIETEFETLKCSDIAWSMVGDSLWSIFVPKECHSCSSLALKLLLAGEIKSILKDPDDWPHFWKALGFFVTARDVNTTLEYRGPHFGYVTTQNGPPKYHSLFFNKPDQGLDVLERELFNAVDPNDVKKIVKAAKKYEVEKNPDTWNYDNHDKGDAKNPSNNESSGCIIS